MKVKVISRNPDNYVRETKKDIHKVFRNYDASLHPFEGAREYVRALNATKLERVFAKPFVGNLDGHKDGISALAKHPKSLSLLLSGSYDGEVKLWDVPNQECVQSVLCHSGYVRGIVFSNDGSRFFTIGDDKAINVWDSGIVDSDETTHEPVNSILGKTVITSISHNYEEPFFATCGETCNIRAGTLEKYGDQILAALNLMWSFGYYTSPLLITFLYRRGYFVAESVGTLAKFTTGIGLLVAVSLCMRGLGRSMNVVYVRFAECLENAKRYDKSPDSKTQIRKYDFDFKHWPVDFTVTSSVQRAQVPRSKPFWISSLPCQIAAYLAIHTFGIRMIYPGSVKLLQTYIEPMLLQGRTKLMTEERGKRNKVKTADSNEIDTVFIDNRDKSSNGRTLVLCSEGNAGFYEIGIMSTPIELQYSVLGWNHPGFAGSSGSPYPDQDQNAVDAVMQFAITDLGFTPENIILYGWSIGGYPTLYAASQYPDVKGVVLDATFDDVLQLAIPRMPESLSNIVKIAIRDYMNLNHTELISQYSGPVMLIRRTEDEIICSEDNNLATNRGNFLLISMLKHRFPNIFKSEQENLAKEILAKPIEFMRNDSDELCLSLLMSYLTDNGNNGTSRSYPIEIGQDYTTEQRDSMAKFLMKKHLQDFKSTHCTPLPAEYFQLPWEIPNDTDFVFT